MSMLVHLKSVEWSVRFKLMARLVVTEDIMFWFSLVPKSLNSLASHAISSVFCYMRHCKLVTFANLGAVPNYGTVQPRSPWLWRSNAQRSYNTYKTLKFAEFAGLPCQPEKTVSTAAWTFGSLCTNFYFHQAVQLFILCRIRCIFCLQPLHKNRKNVPP